MLPEMSGLQFLVVQLLFAGPQRGEQLRRKMRKAGAKVGPPSFSRLMRRMEQAGYLQTQTEAGPAGCRFVWPRRFEVTDLGVAIWRRVREFYTAGGEPPAELVPIASDEGQLAHLTQEARRAILNRRARRHIQRALQGSLRKLAGGS